MANIEPEKGLVLFQSKKIRRVWFNKEWHYSVIDIIAILTEQNDFQTARKYWNKLSQRLREEGSEVVTNCHRLRLPAEDNKLRETDCANTETLLRIIQAIPSKNAEPFKRWLAKVGKERIDEIENPELAQERMKEIYSAKGYPKDWIDKRLRGIAIRQNLTDEWKKRGIEEEKDFAILTAEISKATFGMTPSEYKEFKNLPEQSKANLRDHMNDLEIIFTMLGERMTTEISQEENPETFDKSKNIAKRGGHVAGNARKEAEKELGRPVVSENNFLSLEKKKKRLEDKSD